MQIDSIVFAYGKYCELIEGLKMTIEKSIMIVEIGERDINYNYAFLNLLTNSTKSS